MEQADFDKYRTKKSGYDLPEGYFEAKRKELLNIAVDEPTGKSRVIPLFGWVASGIAAALLIGLFIWGPSTQVDAEPNFDFEYEELAEYVYSSYNYELNEQLLLLEMDEDDLGITDSSDFLWDDLEMLIDESFDQTLNYEYL